MLESVLQFGTPGPLTLPNKLSWRVITSWIASTWILGLLIALFSMFQPNSSTHASSLLFGAIVAFPFAICCYGFIGLAVDYGPSSKYSKTVRYYLEQRWNDLSVAGLESNPGEVRGTLLSLIDALRDALQELADADGYMGNI